MRDCVSEPRLAKFSVVDDANRAMACLISEGLCGAGIDAGNRDIDQFGDTRSGVTAPACRARDGIVETGFGAPDDDRAAVPIDDVDRGLRPHDGIADANDDLFGLQACTRLLVPFPVSPATAGPLPLMFLIQSTKARASRALLRGHEPADICSSMRLPPRGVNRHHPDRVFARVISARRGYRGLPGAVRPKLDDTMRGGRKVRAVAVVYRGDHGGAG